MRRLFPILLGAVAGVAAISTAAPAAMSTYDFESLTANTDIAGQDNWQWVQYDAGRQPAYHPKRDLLDISR